MNRYQALWAVMLVGLLVACIALRFGRWGHAGSVLAPEGHSDGPWTLDLGDGELIEFVRIPAGTFVMGTLGGRPDERPTLKVQFDDGFLMSRYETTNGQWSQVMGRLPLRTQGGARHPVQGVSWSDCGSFIQTLERATGQAGITLPSEAQWEYACRAGTSTAWSCGDDPSGLDAVARYLGNSGSSSEPPLWAPSAGAGAIYGGRPAEVGEGAPNAWGLYDMHGNVDEWCADTWHGDYRGASTDGTPRKNLVDVPRVFAVRGGGYLDPPERVRSAARAFAPDSPRPTGIGFRLVIELGARSGVTGVR